MKQLRLIIVLALLALSSNLKAQTDLVLSAAPTLCNNVYVVVYAWTSCSPHYKTFEFTVTPGSGPTTYNLLNPVYWPNGLPTAPWTIEEVFIQNACALPGGPAGPPCNVYDYLLMNTGILCTALTPTGCFEYSGTCGGCAATNSVNANLTITPTDIILDLN